MRIVYIGANDMLAKTLIDCVNNEEDDVYILSDKYLSQKLKGNSKFRFYRSRRKGKEFVKLLHSVSPDCIIFAGNHYINSSLEEESDEDITLLAWSLRAAAAIPHVKFVLLSSVSVYGNTAERADENTQRVAGSERGIRFIREEELLDIYHKQHGIDAVILRASQLYSDNFEEGGVDFLSRAFTAAAQKECHLLADVFQPLHITDFVEAVKRVVNNGKHYIYNICGSVDVSAKRLYQLICQQENFQKHNASWEDPGCITLASSDRIRQELKWSDFQNLEELLKSGKITYKRTSKHHSSKHKKRIMPKGIRRLAENLLLFAAFFALNYLCSSNELFSQTNWLLIYTIIISISYSIYQSGLAVFLASAAYLYSKNMSFFELKSFSFQAEDALAVTEIIFLGLLVSFTINVIRENYRNIKTEFEALKEDYEDLRSINEENILIRQEYEERLLTSKSGLPKLYSLISRLMVQEPDHILLETMKVISELVQTETVAIYQGKEGSPWFRLVGALNKDSAMEGKSWNISEFPQIYEAVKSGEFYQGAIGGGEPAVVLPIICQGAPNIVILIKSLPYECETLYHVNLLKTMALLLRDSMEKAMQYEELSREDRYVKDTNILKHDAFSKRVLLAQEKADMGVAEYCVVQLKYNGTLSDASDKIGQSLRITDCLGTDEKGNLFALLNNATPENLNYMMERLLNNCINDWSVLDEPMTVLNT